MNHDDVYFAGRSHVFYKALIDNSTNSVRQVLDYNDMKPANFEMLLKYMYTGEVCFSTAEELCFGIYAAARFQLEHVREECESRLRSCFESDAVNAAIFLECDDEFKPHQLCTELRREAKDCVQRQFEDLIKSERIADLSLESMGQLLSLDVYDEVSEIEVFRAVVRWSTRQCSKKGLATESGQLQSVCSDLIYLVRYTLIPAQLLATEVAASGLLTDGLLLTLFRMGQGVRLDVPFCTESRRIVEVGATADVQVPQV